MANGGGMQSTGSAGSSGGVNHMQQHGIPGNVYSHQHYQTNSNNSTKRAIQGMKMHI